MYGYARTVTPEQARRIRDTLRVEAPAPRNMALLYELGQVAFDYIVSLLDEGALLPKQRGFALARLIHLSNGWPFARRIVAIRSAAREVVAADPELRSAAFRWTILGHRLLLGIGGGVIEYQRLLPIVRDAATQARRLGVAMDPMVEQALRALELPIGS